MGRRVLQVVSLFVSGTVTVAIFAVAPDLIHNRLVFGTTATAGPPPRVDYCGRRYYPAETPTVSGNQLHNLTGIETAPSGMPVLANVISLSDRARYRTNVCAMELWVKIGSDEYLGYGLSGGP